MYFVDSAFTTVGGGVSTDGFTIQFPTIGTGPSYPVYGGGYPGGGYPAYPGYPSYPYQQPFNWTWVLLIGLALLLFLTLK